MRLLKLAGIVIFTCFLVTACVDISGNAWIDSPEASYVSQILGYIFLGWLSVFIIVQTVKATRRDE